MSTVKASHYIQVLDEARCNGRWDVVPEWCRKVGKHAEGRLALTAETEARLQNLPPPPPSSTKPTKASYAASLNALQNPLRQEIDSYQQPLPKLPAPAGGGHSTVVTEEDLLQARIVIAWISSLKGEWHDVLDIIPGEEELGEGCVPYPGKSEYLHIMRIMALVLKGIALSHTTSDTSLPLQLYRAATRLPSAYTAAHRQYPACLIWTEKAQAQYALAAYKCWLEAHAPPTSPTLAAAPLPSKKPYCDSVDEVKAQEAAGADEKEEAVGVAIGKTIVDSTTVANAFRTFHAFLTNLQSTEKSTQNTTTFNDRVLNVDREAGRRELYRRYFKFLSLFLLPPSHPEYPTPSPVLSIPKLVAGQASTPTRKGEAPSIGSAEEVRRELKLIERIYEDYLMKTLGFPRADEYHAMIGEWIDQVMDNWTVCGGLGEDAALVVEILYRAAQKTFHSPRLLRHLFHALTATGNFTDAISALETYLDLVQKAKERIAKGHQEKDFDSDDLIFQAVAEGIRVLCKFTVKAEKAIEIANKAERWADDWRITDKDLLADLYRCIGMANASWARLTPDGDQRRPAQVMAADAFKKGLSYDPTDIQGWYGAALVEAELGRAEDAAESARRGLGALKLIYVEHEGSDETEGRVREYKRWATALLHILALLMTAQDDFENADKVCKNAFDIIGEGREAVNELGVIDRISILELMMTRLAITEATEGSEAAIPMANELLELYSVLFDGTHLIEPLDAAQPSENPPGYGSVASSRPATTASRRSRLLGRRHKKQFSASYSSLPQSEASVETPPSRSGTLRKRPKSGHQSLKLNTESNLPPVTPKIQVTDAAGTASSPSEKSHRKSMRSNSVSGGTIRRMRSLGSIRLKGEHKDDSPTPPLPSSTETSSLNFGLDRPTGRDPHLFHALKTKLHQHQLQQASSSLGGSANSVALEPSQHDGAPEGSEWKESPAKQEDTPNNLSQSKLALRLDAISRDITDETNKGKPQSRRRPVQLPEPKLGTDEKAKVLGALRQVWLCVAALYRRAKFFEDSGMAVEEAQAFVGNDGDGEADVLAEKGFLALDQERADIALELFEQALVMDVNHPQAIVGLTGILLVNGEDIESTDTSSAVSSNSSTDGDDTSNEEALMDKLAARDRSLHLLESLVNTSRGWNIPEAWYLLSRAVEQSGEVEKAKTALWRVVELEDCTAVRSWSSCGAGVV